MCNLQGKVAVITGGGTGLGKAISLMLAKAGVSIAVNYSKSEKEASETVEEIKKLGVNALACKADISSDKEVVNMFVNVYKILGRVDFLVNNAGYTKFVALDDLESMTDEIWDTTLSINLKGNMYCTRQAIKYMKMNSDSKGSIVNIAGTAGLTGIGSSIIYCASKAGILSFTRSFAIAFAPDIQVNAVSPGIIEDTRWCAGQNDFKEAGRKETPMRRLARAEDIAEAVFYLFASSHYITGQNLIIDGGRVMR